MVHVAGKAVIPGDSYAEEQGMLSWYFVLRDSN